MPPPLPRPYPAVAILGPTASGKSRLAMALAARFNAEIISFDSIKVYRGMDIGTDKPAPEEIERFGYHLVNIRVPSETMNAGEFVRLAEQALEDILSRRRLPVIEGGSALYLKSFIWGIFKGPARDEAYRQHLYRRAQRDGAESLHAQLQSLDPARAADIQPHDLKRIVRALEIARVSGLRPSELRKEWGSEKTRPGYAFILIGLRRPRRLLYRRIDERLERMMQQGLLAEVAAIWQSDGFSRTSSEAIGYRQLVDYLEGKTEREGRPPSLDEALRRIKKATRIFARRQEAWFRRFEGVEWFQPASDEMPLEEVASHVARTLPSLAPAWAHLLR